MTQYVVNWISKNGIVTDSCYPYFSGTTKDKGECKNVCVNEKDKFTHYFFDAPVHFNWPEQKFPVDDLIKELVENGPFYFSMQVKDDFKQYRGGVYLNRTAKAVGGHAVKVVGFGQEIQEGAQDPLDNWYWIVANSWGPRFGESGYFRIAMSENIAYLASALTPQKVWREKESISELLRE